MISKSIARALRRIAHRLDPEFIRTLDVTYQQGKPTHIDLQLQNGRRVKGYVQATPGWQHPDGWANAQNIGPYATP